LENAFEERVFFPKIFEVHTQRGFGNTFYRAFEIAARLSKHLKGGQRFWSGAKLFKIPFSLKSHFIPKQEFIFARALSFKSLCQNKIGFLKS